MSDILGMLSKELLGNKDFLTGIVEKVDIGELKDHLIKHGIEDVDGDGLDLDDLKAEAAYALETIVTSQKSDKKDTKKKKK